MVNRLWPGETVVCIATGPSLTPEDVNYCRGKARVIVINDAYTLAPWADVLYACDGSWWVAHPDAAEFAGLKFGITVNTKRFPQVVALKATGPHGIETDPSGVRTSFNSGYQAINVAVHLGATRILLLGYDMQQLPGQLPHFFGAHPNGKKPLFKKCLAGFPTLVEPLRAAGVEVINCTRQTALTCFPQASLTSALRVEVAA